MKDYTVEIERTYRTVLTVKALNRKQAMRDAQGISRRGKFRHVREREEGRRREREGGVKRRED